MSHRDEMISEGVSPDEHPRKIIHVDMDCFFAAIEMRDDPNLRLKPVAVGGSSDRRGVISTANYIARQYGVRSAMATAQALRLCPHLVLVKPNFQKYKAASDIIREVFSQYTDFIEPLSLDEAYLDLTDSQQFNGSATLTAQAIRQEIHRRCHITASAGIAPNKYLAKIASDWQKPNGQFTITPQQVQAFLKPLDVGKLPGVGKVTVGHLNALGIHTIADLQHYPLEFLQTRFGVFGKRLFQLARGIDNRPVGNHSERKSISLEHTYASDLTPVAASQEIPELYHKLCQRLEKKQNPAISKQLVKIKFSNFQSTTMECGSKMLSLAKFQLLYDQACQRQALPIRLLGLGVKLDLEQAIEPLQLSFGFETGVIA